MVVEAVVCPKCGHQQEDTFECHQCGIIFHKYKEKPPMSRSPTVHLGSPARSAKTATDYQSLGKLVVAVGLMAIAIFLLLRWYTHRPIIHGPGMIAPRIPIQINLRQKLSFRYKDYVITPLAMFDLEARVLGIKKYRFDRQADLSPYDVALGWGRMSDETVLNALSITQSNRFYYWWGKRFPISGQAIAVSSANMHLIPANQDITKQLRRVRKGHVVSIKGFLVRADVGNWHWISSMTRQDTGAGACELIWVQNFAIR